MALRSSMERSTVRRFLMAPVILAALLAAGACDNGATEPDGTGRIRIVNAVFQGASAAEAVPIAIDVLIDSVGASPGAVEIPPVALAPGTSADAMVAAAGYRDIATGVHGFTARASGTLDTNSSLYRSTAATEYLPKQYVTTFPFTLIVAGVIPPPGAPVEPTAVPFAMLSDDPFTPPSRDGVLQARVRVINAAPYTSEAGTGSTISVYLTPGSTAPATLPPTADATARYRNGSVYLNRDAGTYTVTLVAGASAVYQAPITLGAGEVRTLILQSIAAGAPAAANHTVRDLLDNMF